MLNLIIQYYSCNKFMINNKFIIIINHTIVWTDQHLKVFYYQSKSVQAIHV